MKTSTKLLAGAIVILIIAIGIYNQALKAEFTSGNYKSPYRGYKAVGINGFTQVEINGAKMIDVELKQGDFAVYNLKSSSDTVRFTKVGNRLIVNIDLLKKPEQTNADGSVTEDFSQYRENRVIIVCPSLSVLQTSNAFMVNGKVLTNYDYDKYSPYSHHSIEVKNFKLDSLSLIQGGNSLVDLITNKIEVLKVNADHRASFKIEEDNTIGNADLQMNKKSELWLNNVSFPKLTYHLSDSANVTLYGKSVKSMVKP